ncbi:glycosyltransferase, partial [Pseudonocardia sp. KRD291]|uniref:glycosyltransferase n=1 Tax=Pseudonocardia sp. KRD291 TaxID=2792007 RepID=UPI001C4A616A
MRIDLVSAHVSPCAEPGEPGWSGQAVLVRELAESLAGAGHEVTVLARRDDVSRASTAQPLPNLTIRHLDAGPPAALSDERLVAAVPELARLLGEQWRSDPPDVVHAHHWTSGLAAAAAADGIVRVQTFHTLSRPDGGAGPAGRASAEQAVARSADRVVALCEDELSDLLQRGAPRSRLRVVPAGIDTGVWRPDGPSLRRAGHPRIVSVGSVAPDDGADELLEALRRVPDAELFVAGGPAPERAADDTDLERLHAVAARAGVATRVRLLAAVSRDDVPRLIRSADVLVSAPRRESSGTAALEAMACGRPVVATAVGGLRDMVVDQVTGLQVLPGRPADLAAALREMVADAGTGTAFGIAGRDRASSRYDRSRTVEAMTQVYREAIAAAAGTGDVGD